MARFSKDRFPGRQYSKSRSTNGNGSCTATGITRGLRLAPRFFRFGNSGSSIGSNSCIQMSFSMPSASSPWFISDGRARLRAWAAIADEHHPTERTETVNARSGRLRCHGLPTSPLLSVCTELERSGHPGGLGVYFLGKRVIGDVVQDHCPTQAIVGQGVTSPLAGKPPGWGSAPMRLQRSPTRRRYIASVVPANASNRLGLGSGIRFEPAGSLPAGVRKDA